MVYKIALAQADATLGDVAANLERHLDWIARAREAGADLLVFPELSLTGYLLQDLVSEVALVAGRSRVRADSRSGGRHGGDRGRDRGITGARAVSSRAT